MNALQEAADQVKNAGRMFRAVVLLADAVEKIGSVDAAAAEADARLSVARAGADKAEKELAAVLVEVSDAKGLALRIVQEAEDAGKRLRAAASQDVSEARAEASKVAGELIGLRRSVEDQIKKERAELGAVIETLHERKQDLVDLEARIAAAKAAALKVLGA